MDLSVFRFSLSYHAIANAAHISYCGLVLDTGTVSIITVDSST
jgi:hypothetical protein